MIAEVLQYLNRFFIDTLETATNYNIVTDGIEGTFAETYVVGQYISLDGSKLNDGIYKLSAISTSKLTVEETLLAEATNNYICLWGLAIPQTVLSLITEITNYKGKEGLTSESQGDRAVSYANSSGWQDAYRSRLNKYRVVYLDKTSYYDYNINIKR